MAISTSTLSIINTVLNIISAFVKFKLYKVESNAAKREQIIKALDTLDEACNSGTLSDLLDATEKYGESKK